MLSWEGIIYDMMSWVLSFDFEVFFTIAASHYRLPQDQFKSCQQYLRRCAFKPKSGDCGVHDQNPQMVGWQSGMERLMNTWTALNLTLKPEACNTVLYAINSHPQA